MLERKFFVYGFYNKLSLLQLQNAFKSTILENGLIISKIKINIEKNSYFSMLMSAI